MSAPPAAMTIAALLREQAERYPDRVAILAPGRAALPYAGLWHQAQHLAERLRSHGVTPTTRVAVVLVNGPEMAAAFLSVAACAVCVPLNPAYRAAEFVAYLKHTRARVVVVGSDERTAVQPAATALGLPVLEIERDMTHEAGRFTIAAGAGERMAAPAEAATHDTALILHTSGTTALPKIVPLSHSNLIASARALASALALRPSDRCLNVMPLFHIHGLVGALLATVAGGASIVCAPGFDERSFFDWVAEFDPTWYTAAPTIHQAVVAQGARYRELAPRHRFRFVRSSSSPLPPATLRALQALTGAPVIEAYGMTEAAHEMASNPLCGPCKPGTVGVPTGVELEVMDESGRPAATGSIGEIVIRGPSVCTGYEDSPVANAAAWRDGWFRTGDLGVFDGDGYLSIVGRLKEMVNRGGEKISPREVDDALLEHPDVRQAVAFPIPHPSLGEDLAALVVLRDGASADEAALRAFLAARLAQFKVPSNLLFVDTIPKGATGKVQRTGLHEQCRHLMRRTFAVPRNETERSLARIFGEVLTADPVGIDDNFFAIGGDSLKGAQVIARIRAHHGVDIAVSALFAAPTVAALAPQVRAAEAAAQTRLGALEAEIEQMSDEEVARLLALEEARVSS